jgi:hypothetical protein
MIRAKKRQRFSLGEISTDAFPRCPARVLIVRSLCRPDGVGTVTHDEKEKFQEVKERLRILLEHQITNFRFCFPFGRPEGALKATLSLLERVSY